MDKYLSKNILFFQNSILPANGGVPRVSHVISSELERRGHKCYFVYYDVDHLEYPQDKQLKINLNEPYKSIEQSVLKLMDEKEISVIVCQNAYLRTFRRLFKQLRILYPNILFICFLHASPNYWQNIYKIKQDFSEHRYFSNALKKVLKRLIYPFYNPYLIQTKDLYNISDKFILLSDSFKNSFTEIYKVDGHKLNVLPNPLTFDHILSVEELAKKEKIVLMVCRLDEGQKKISVALKIWKQLAQNLKYDWKLIIIGTGPDEEFYRSYIKNNSLKNVLLLGQKDNIINYYKVASIFLLTSIWEGLPMALLEAQQTGVVPIVFDNFSAVYDVLINNENGYIIANNNMQQFSEKLTDLMNDSDLRNKMALKSIETSRRYRVSTIADQWEKILNS